jgi:O-antigen/teichoic acid export membrane protein
MTMKRSLAFNLLGQGGVFLFGFTNAVLSARILGAEGKGQLAIYLLAVELGAVVTMVGMAQAFQYYASRDRFRSQKTLNTAAVIAALGAAGFLLAVQVVFLLGQGDRILPAPFNTPIFRGVIAIHLFYQIFGTLLAALLNSYKLFEQTSKVALASIVFLSLIYLAFFLIHREGSQEVLVNYFYFSLLAAAILNVGLGLWVYRKYIPAAGASASWGLLAGPQLRRLAAFGLFPWVSVFMMRAVAKLDYWFVEGFLGLHTLGLYSAASNIGETLYLVPNTVGVVVLSFIADPETRVDSTHRTATMARLFFVVMIVGAVALSMVSSDLFAFAFGDEFRASGPILNMLLWGIVPFGLATILIGYLTGAKQLKVILASASMGLALTILFDLLLIPELGVQGAAISRVIAFNVMTWYLVMHFKRTSGLPYRRFLLPSRADIAVIRKLLSRSNP